MSAKAVDIKEKFEATKMMPVQATQSLLSDSATSGIVSASASASAPAPALVPFMAPPLAIAATSLPRSESGSAVKTAPISQEHLEKIERFRLFALEIGSDPEQFIKEQLALEQKKLDEEDRAFDATGAIINNTSENPTIIQPSPANNQSSTKIQADHLKNDKKGMEEKFRKEDPKTNVPQSAAAKPAQAAAVEMPAIMKTIQLVAADAAKKLEDKPDVVQRIEAIYHYCIRNIVNPEVHQMGKIVYQHNVLKEVIRFVENPEGYSHNPELDPTQKIRHAIELASLLSLATPKTPTVNAPSKCRLTKFTGWKFCNSLRHSV